MREPIPLGQLLSMLSGHTMIAQLPGTDNALLLIDTSSGGAGAALLLSDGPLLSGGLGSGRSGLGSARSGRSGAKASNVANVIVGANSYVGATRSCEKLASVHHGVALQSEAWITSQ